VIVSGKGREGYYFLLEGRQQGVERSVVALPDRRLYNEPGEKMKEEAMKSLSLKVPDRLDAQLRAAARMHGKSKAAVVKEALQAYLANQKNGTPKLSCFDMAPDVWGSLEGPGDLSYNKKYMEGYGQ
jgi:hypothetical protein